MYKTKTITTNSNRVTRLQLTKITEFMEKYPELYHGIVGKNVDERKYKDGLWRELTDILNAEDGAKKSPVKWRKTFKDYKCYVKKKYMAYLVADSSTHVQLSQLDVRVLTLMGYMVDIAGMDDSDGPIYIMEEIKGSVDEDAIHSRKYKEQSPKFYHAPEIIKLLQKDVSSSPMDDSEMTSNKENSKSIQETTLKKQKKKLPRSKEHNYYNEELPNNEESSSDEEIVRIQQKDAHSKPMVTPDDSEMTSNKENSINIEETTSKKQKKILPRSKDHNYHNKELPNNEESSSDEEIIRLQQKVAHSTPDDFEMTSNQENSKNKEEMTSKKQKTKLPRSKDHNYHNEELPNNEETSSDEELQFNEESPCNEEYPLNEEMLYNDKSPTKRTLNKISKHKKQLKKKRRGKNATAAALQAIAKELSMKNELTKMKIELEKEKLIVEKRKTEAFELIAKQLYRDK